MFWLSGAYHPLFECIFTTFKSIKIFQEKCYVYVFIFYVLMKQEKQLFCAAYVNKLVLK
jgi:hypothetical protein